MAEGDLWRRRGESQTDSVRRILRERGHISVNEALYQMRWSDGSVRGARITRLATVIYRLRHRDGMPIDAVTAKLGQTATYRLSLS